MDSLSIAIIIFIILESLNVLILFFKPESRMGNGVAVFNGWEDSKEYMPIHLFVQYMTNWVAGVKLIFIFLLVVVLITGTQSTKLFAVIAMILSIATYFYRLNPLIKKLDDMGHITPKGYSRALEKMIVGFLCMFIIALLIYFI